MHLLSVPAAILLGIVEGITEFLPISSTGHLTIAERLLDLRGSAADAYLVVIQAGAILAVAVLYWRRITSMFAGVFGRDDEGRGLLLKLIVAFLPAAAIGFAFGDTIKEHLLGAGPVAAAWAVGAIVILVATPRIRVGGRGLDGLTTGSAFVIGVAQALALWPGVSRSLVTILAALAVGLSLAAAIEFSFLLGLLTLGAATALDAVKHGGDIVHSYGVLSPVLGFVVAFVSAVVAVRWMVNYLQRGSLNVFAYYRLLAAGVAVVLLLTNAV
jgi:undecaprenyl-diphosphatase